MSELVKRLGYHRENEHGKLVLANPDGPEAANYITALEAENKALREAMREIIDLIVTCPDAPRAPDSLPQCIRLVAARALLAKEKTS